MEERVSNGKGLKLLGTANDGMGLQGSAPREGSLRVVDTCGVSHQTMLSVKRGILPCRPGGLKPHQRSVFPSELCVADMPSCP